MVWSYSPRRTGQGSGVGLGLQQSRQNPTARTDVTIRIIPWSVGAYPGIGRPCVLFRMAEGTSVVYFDRPHAAQFIEDPDECRAARDVFDRLPAYAA